MTTAVVKNIISRLIFRFRLSINFPFRLCTRFWNRKREKVQPQRQTKIVKFCCLTFTLFTEPQT